MQPYLDNEIDGLPLGINVVAPDAGDAAVGRVEDKRVDPNREQEAGCE